MKNKIETKVDKNKIYIGGYGFTGEMVSIYN
jgi:hypothetical protein